MELEGIILKPGERWDESTLRSITDTAHGKPVKYSSDFDAPVIGKITDAEYVDGEGIRCEMDIQDDDISTLFKRGDVSPAPALEINKEVGDESAQFDSVFATPHPDENVGEFNRKI